MNSNFVILWILLGTCATIPLPHEFMTPEERLEIFQTDDKLPVYEVIEIHLSKLHKRSTSRNNQMIVSMRAFNENITLLCEENDGILAGKNTPIYFVRNRTNAVTIKKTPATVGHIKLYENIPAGATLTICSHQNRQRITGVIKSKRLVIRSLPDRVAKKIFKHRRSLGNTSGIIEEKSYYIAIKNIPSQSLNITHDLNARLKRAADEIPNVFPEILVIVDYDLERILNENGSGNLVPYILSFWHAVDLMFRNLFDPEIKLNIAGIVIAKSPNVFEYLYENEIQLTRKKYGLNTYAALKNMGSWLYNHSKDISLNDYDVAFTMTSSSLCGYSGCDYFINGLSQLSGACDIDEERKTTDRVGIIQNKGAYDRIVTAAHELGHLLGADHDGDDGCQSNRLMMTQYGGDRDSADWSVCSLEAFDNFLRSGMAKCLFNKPNPGKIVRTVLPGELMNSKEQCAQLGYGNSCQTKKSKGICADLRCRSRNDPKGKCIRLNMPAATGTPCARGKICYQLKCVDKHELM